MNWWTDFADQMKPDAPLGQNTWFRLGGRARYLFRPRDTAELGRFLPRAREEEIPVRVLGRGANVLVSDDGFDGVVVRLDAPAFRKSRQLGTRLEVGAGVDLMPLVKQCSETGLTGLEALAGIPATIGGAVRMNAGGRGGEIGDVVRSVTVLTPEGERQDWTRDQVGFGYRRSQMGENIVLSATLELREDDPERVRRDYREHLEQKQRSQPLAEHSAGCIFKNPAGQAAGALIDRAGLKGTRYGEAEVSTMHANFIVAHDGATASDILHLIDVVRDRVYSEFDTQLETEIEIWKPQHAGLAALG